MMWVQFPSGVRVKYNNAHHLTYETELWRLYTDSTQKVLVAAIQASAGVIIEFQEACHVENPTTDLNKMTERLVRHLRDVKPWNLKDLKRELTKFNARSGGWKD